MTWSEDSWTSVVSRARRPGVVAAACAGVALLPWIGPEREADPSVTAVARRGTFRESIVESGTIAAAGLKLYGSTLAGVQAKLVFLAPEGHEVAAGDELIRFDAAPFELALARESAVLAQAEAELSRAREDERLEQLSADGERSAAALKLTSAASALRNAADGRGQMALEEAEVAEADARRAVTRARQQVDDLEALLARGFATRAEVDRAGLDLGRAEDQHRLAVRKLASIRDFERPAALDEGRAGVDAARQDATRAAEAMAARLAQRRSTTALALRRVDECRARVAQATDHLARTTVRADAGGLVVYRDLYFGTDRRKPQVGDEVWSNQPLLAVPDTRDVLVDTRVREVDLHRIAASRHVEVTVDAYPDLRLAGTVSLVGTLAQEDLTRGGIKFFPVTVTLSAPDTRLRPGMTARVEIVVAERRDVLMVPTDAVRARGDGTLMVEIVDGGGTRRVPVRRIADNGVAAVIEGQVDAGSRVRLASARGERP
jgi:HlyD family secretion protein